MRRKNNSSDLNIFGNVDYLDMIEENRGNESAEEREKKGFEYAGFYVVGTTKEKFKKLLEDVNWMKF